MPEIDFAALGPLHLGTISKTQFSMLTPQLIDIAKLNSRAADETSIVLFGIESHVCVLQTAVELLQRRFSVHVLADGVSSCNREEVPIALEYIRRAGGHVLTSECVAFQLMRDSSDPLFKSFATVIKEEKELTKTALEQLTVCSDH